MPIANVELTNTFNEWRLSYNQSLQYTNTLETDTFTKANLVSNNVTVRVSLKNDQGTLPITGNTTFSGANVDISSAVLFSGVVNLGNTHNLRLSGSPSNGLVLAANGTSFYWKSTAASFTDLSGVIANSQFAGSQGISSNVVFSGTTVTFTANANINDKLNIGVANLAITGGSAGMFLQTDGAGNQVWVANTVGNLGITTALIKDLNVTTGKLAAGAVTTAKMANGSITLPKFNSGIYATTSEAQTGTNNNVLITPSSWSTRWTYEKTLSQTFSAKLTLGNGLATQTPLSGIYSSATTTTYGPLFELERRGFTTAGTLGGIQFAGRNSTNVKVTYSSLLAYSKTATGGSEDGGLRFRVYINGTARDVIDVDETGMAFKTATGFTRQITNLSKLSSATIVNTGSVTTGTLNASNGVSTVGLTMTGAGSASIGDEGTVTSNTALDMSSKNNFKMKLGGNITLSNPTGFTPGQSGSIIVEQDTTGNRTMSFGSYWKFTGGLVPTISTTGGAIDRLDYYVANTTAIHMVESLNVS